MPLIPTRFFLRCASHVTQPQLSFRGLEGELWSCQNRWNKTFSLSWGHNKHSRALWHFGIAAGACCLPRSPSCSQAGLRIMLWTPSRGAGHPTTVTPGSTKENKEGICSYLGRPWSFPWFFFRLFGWFFVVAVVKGGENIFLARRWTKLRNNFACLFS